MEKATYVVLAAALAAAGCLHGGETVLFPKNGKFEMRATDGARLSFGRDGIAVAETGVDYPWPGMKLDFKRPFDLSDYGWIRVAVTNMTDRKIVVQLSVKSRAPNGREPGGLAWIEPHACQIVQANLMTTAWELKTLVALDGMNGYPTCSGSDKNVSSRFDAKGVTSLHIFRGEKPEPARFAVTRVTVGGSPASVAVLPGRGFLPFVDVFGQFAHADWPGKIKSETDFAKAREIEEKWLAVHDKSPIPDADRFGGWSGGPKLKATGFFRTEKVDGKWWLVDPDGHLFFSLGVTCVCGGQVETCVSSREEYFASVPDREAPVFGAFWRDSSVQAARGFYSDPSRTPYAMFDFGAANCRRKYGEEWRRVTAELAHRRMASWGLNTLANWSAPAICSMRRTPYVLTLGTGGAPRTKLSSGVVCPDGGDPEFESAFRANVQKVAGSVRDDPWCVGVFVDNEPGWARSQGIAEAAEKYFSAVAKVLKEELPNHLYLGCRFAGGSDDAYRAAARHCHVVSANVYSRLPDVDLPPGSVDKPLIVGEFHFGGLDRGMFDAGLVPSLDQRERARSYCDYVNKCLDSPRYVGAHWFQWKDQPLTGRPDGENAQIGFLSVTDTPYPEMIAASRHVASHMYDRRYSARTEGAQKKMRQTSGKHRAGKSKQKVRRTGEKQDGFVLDFDCGIDLE